MNSKTEKEVYEYLQKVMKRVIDRRVIAEPFIESEISTKNPFGALLVPMDIWKGAKFERSFVTSLGQGIYEQVAQIIANGTGATTYHQKEFEVKINTSVDDYINDVADGEYPDKTWSELLSDIAGFKNKRSIDHKVLFDLVVERQNGATECYSLKTVKPNIDQTTSAKRMLLRTKAAQPSTEAYFALPYNPAGDGNPYAMAGHTQPTKVLDMEDNSVVLIGRDFWNKIGDSQKTYDKLLSIFEEVGDTYSIPRIQKEYLD